MLKPLLQQAYCQIPQDQQLLVQRFEQSLIAANLSNNTVRIRMASLARFQPFAGCFSSPSSDSFLLFLKHRRLSGVSVSSINQDLTALRLFYRFLYKWQYTATDLSEYVPESRRSPPKRLVRFLTEHQVGQLLAAPDLSTLIGFRDHVIIRLLYETGLRASELVALELGSLNLSEHLIYINNGKGQVDRYVPHSAELALLLGDWLALRKTTLPGKRVALFVTQHGKAFSTRKAVWDIVNRYARQALGLARGYDKITRTAMNKPWQGVYPHLLRASFATHLLHNGCNLRAVQEMLGHANVNSTAHYLGVDLNLLKHEIAKLPRSKMKL